jgi:hypothetical protein
MTESVRLEATERTSPAVLAGLTVAALAGAADTAIFIATNPQTALKTGGRAGGSVAGLAVWVLLLAVSSRRWRGPDGRRLAAIGLLLAALAALDGVGLAAIHLAAGVGGLRTVIGAAAGVVALSLALKARRAGH